MKLQSGIGSEKHEIEINHNGREVRASINGREYLIDASEPEPDVYLFKHDNSVYEASLTGIGNEFNVQLRGREHEITIIDPKRLRGSGGGADHASGRAEIKTAMPGKVVRILVAAGDEVQKGDGVIVVEAMKMQNEMKSPKDGTVSEIRVAESATVGAGDVLVVID